jgi:hypothetical protein
MKQTLYLGFSVLVMITHPLQMGMRIVVVNVYKVFIKCFPPYKYVEATFGRYKAVGS